MQHVYWIIQLVIAGPYAGSHCSALDVPYWLNECGHCVYVCVRVCVCVCVHEGGGGKGYYVSCVRLILQGCDGLVLSAHFLCCSGADSCVKMYLF